MTQDAVMIALTGVTGIVLGALNAWGLWLTARHVAHARLPGVLVLLSLFARVLVPIGLLLVLAGGLLPRLLTGVAAFVIARLVTVRIIAAKAHQASGGKRPGA